MCPLRSLLRWQGSSLPEGEVTVAVSWLKSVSVMFRGISAVDPTFSWDMRMVSSPGKSYMDYLKNRTCQEFEAHSAQLSKFLEILNLLCYWKQTLPVLIFLNHSRLYPLHTILFHQGIPLPATGPRLIRSAFSILVICPLKSPSHQMCNQCPMR